MLEKPFTNIEEQIDILLRRNLSFENIEYAKGKLLQHGYYEIINGYKDFLIDHIETEKKGEDYFKDGATFEHIYDLFYLDKKIRNAVLLATLEIECLLRNAISYVVADSFGHVQLDYLERKNYRPGKINYNKKHEKDGYKIDQIIHKFKKIINDDVQPMKHYKKIHGNVPPWIMLKGATFGNLVHFYKLQKPEQKNEILAILSGKKTDDFKKDESLKVLYSDLLFLNHSFRNRSAHSGRMYNYRALKSEVRYNQRFHEQIKTSKTEYLKQNKGKYDLFTFYNAITYFDNHSAKFELSFTFNWYLSTHLEKYPEDKKMLLHEMGFPEDFKIKKHKKKV